MPTPPSSPPQLPPGWLIVGKLVAAQGLQGELRVYPDSDFPERFLEPGDRWLWQPGPHQPQPVQLKAGRSLDNKGLYVVKFASITNRNQAEAVVGFYLLVPEGDRPQLEAGEFHVADLIGLPVYDQASQTLIGHVTRLFPAGHDLLEVTPAEGNPLLIPFVEAIVPVVDLAQGRIEITPPAGLLDL